MISTIRRTLFKEENWAVSTWGVTSRVEHLNCRKEAFGGIDGIYPTYGTMDFCYGCKEPMPDFILNMRTFLRWCGEW